MTAVVLDGIVPAAADVVSIEAAIAVDTARTLSTTPPAFVIEEATLDRPKPVDDDTTAVAETTPRTSIATTTTTTPSSSSSSSAQRQHPYHIMTTVYVREGDGMMYKAIIRRSLFGRKFQHTQAQLAMGEKSNDDDDDDHNNGNANTTTSTQDALEEDEDDTNDDTSCPAMWHYFVHFPGWKVTHDRWASQPEVFDVHDETAAYVERLNREHKTLHKSMIDTSTRRGGNMKRHQKVSGVQFLAEWSKRLRQITDELPAGGQLRTALEYWQASRRNASHQKDDTSELEEAPSPANTTAVTNKAASQAKKKRSRSSIKNRAALSPEIVQNEVRLRQEGLTTGRVQRSSNKLTITLPFGLKKILVEQWQLICQCGMLPILPPPITIRDALEAYVASKVGGRPHEDRNVSMAVLTTNSEPATTPLLPEAPPPSNMDATTTHDADASSPDLQDWLVMADGIVQLFNESLPIRLLYDQEEIFHFEDSLVLTSSTSSLPPPASSVSKRNYADVYGCEHLLRLFVKLPELLADDNNYLTSQQTRPIVAKVNDLVRFLHKNHGTFFRQQHLKLARPAGTFQVGSGPSPTKMQKTVS